MKYFFGFLALLILFWLVVFNIDRLVFFLLHLHQLRQVSLLSTLGTPWQALKLDISATSYLLFIPFILLLANFIFPWRGFRVATDVVNIFFLIIVSLTVAGNYVLYDEWKVKINYEAIEHFRHPSEVIQTGSGTYTIKFIVFAVLYFGLCTFLYFKVFRAKYKPDSIKGVRKAVATLLLAVLIPGLLFLGIRGGIQPIPINLSQSYFSKEPLLNDAAVNTTWNLFQSIYENLHTGVNTYHFMSDESAEAITNKLYYTPKDTTIHFLTTDKPNVVLFLIESWSAETMEWSGSTKGVVPFFDSIAANGVHFTNVSASGMTSDRGMAAIFSGFPSFPDVSITTQPAKYNRLPSLNHEMKEAGYRTSYSFGGQLIYGNIKSYIYYNAFDKIREKDDFDKSLPRGKLGIHDEYMMSEELKLLNTEQAPFFSVLYTLSSHAPFDFPRHDNFHAEGADNLFMESAHYVDGCLRNFFAEAKKQPWYHNTLFVFIADHGHGTTNCQNVSERCFIHIPIVFYGDVVKPEFKGKKLDMVASELDFPTTLLAQLNLPTHDFRWSKNLMNPYAPQFAYYAFFKGYGWIKPNGNYSFEERYQKFIEKNVPPGESESQFINEGRAVMQAAYKVYLGK